MNYFQELKTKEDWYKLGIFSNLSEEQGNKNFELLNQLNTIINEKELSFDGINAIYGTLTRIYRTLVIQDYKNRPSVLDKYTENEINELINLININKFLGYFIANISLKYVIQKYFRNLDSEISFVDLFTLDYINGLVKEFEMNNAVVND